MEEKKLRQPIVTVCGHVDHGKTTILDKLRGTAVQVGEAGGITQKISFTTMPKETLLKRAGTILEKFKVPLEIPGFLLIDTPGHAAFTNLRKRGGALADLAVLVIDINEGIKPQTAEVLNLLKLNKTPFVIALNKIDNISGWKTAQSKLVLDSINNQGLNVKQNFDEKYFTIIGALQNYGIDPELYMKISDFTKNIAIVPCSAKTGEGIEELLAILSALSQKFLKEQLTVAKLGRGIILEVKRDKSFNRIESILYDGKICVGDEVVIASFNGVLIGKIRGLEEALPLNRGFESTDEINAAAGMRLLTNIKGDLYSGMPFAVLDSNLEELEEEFSRELESNIELDSTGIIARADSLGSLEALLTLLRQSNVLVARAEIGPINKTDLIFASSLEEENRIIAGFNVDLDESITGESKDIKILSGSVVYKIIEDLEKYRIEKRTEIERKKLAELPSLTKLNILDFVFRNSSPAIFGVRVVGGLLRREIEMINSKDEKIGRVKAIQHDKNSIDNAGKDKEVAISIPGVTFDRQLTVGENLYSNLSEFQFRKFKENRDLLSSEEKHILQEIASIKRRENVSWGV